MRAVKILLFVLLFFRVRFVPYASNRNVNWAVETVSVALTVAKEKLPQLFFRVTLNNMCTFQIQRRGKDLTKFQQHSRCMIRSKWNHHEMLIICSLPTLLMM